MPSRSGMLPSGRRSSRIGQKTELVGERIMVSVLLPRVGVAAHSVLFPEFIKPLRFELAHDPDPCCRRKKIADVLIELNRFKTIRCIEAYSINTAQIGEDHGLEFQVPGFMCVTLSNMCLTHEPHHRIAWHSELECLCIQARTEECRGSGDDR